MSEPRRSTRTRAREEAVAAPPPESPKDTPTKPPARAPAKSTAGTLKRKRLAIDSTPATPTAESAQQQGPRHVLPVRLLDGQPLPTLPEPQPLDLPAEQYQSIQQSGILSASLQRSRAVWISGANFRLFHAFFVHPKKVADRTDEDKQNMQRQKEIIRNFPQLGGGADSAIARMVIEPHTFPIRLYGPREAVRPVPKKTPQYGQWPNHTTHGQYPVQQPPPPHQQHQQQQYHHPPPAPYVKPQPPQQQRPSVPKPPPHQNPPPPAPTTPAPDPVIHMLAQRAGADPELKAVMKIVAAGKATDDQLQFFQRHIAELTAILQRQKETAARAPPQPPPPPPAPKVQPPPPPPAPVQPVPPPQPVPVVHQHHHYTPNMHSPAPSTPGPHHQMAPTPTPHQQPYQSPNTYNQHYNQPPQYHGNYGTPVPTQPPRATYRPLVFDFVEGNGDKFYFPSYSFMEWLPNNQGAKFSFLITRMKPKPKVEPKQVTPVTPAPKATPAAPQGSTPAAMPTTPNPVAGPSPMPNAPAPPQTPQAPQAPQTATPVPPQPTQYVPPPRIEDFDEKKDTQDIELYQPVTVIILTQNYEILQSLPRAIRPPDVVEKYMNTVFDTSKRAEETYLAFRLPKEGAPDAEPTSAKERRESHDVAASTVDVVMTDAAVAEKKRAAGRQRKSLV